MPEMPVINGHIVCGTKGTFLHYNTTNLYADKFIRHSKNLSPCAIKPASRELERISAQNADNYESLERHLAILQFQLLSGPCWAPRLADVAGGRRCA